VWLDLPAEECRTQPGFEPLTYDRVVGINNLYSIAWLQRGIELSRPVARVVLDGGRERATGFVIDGDRFLTNHHVLPDEAVAADAAAEFNVERGWDGRLKSPTTRKFDVGTEFITDPDLDFTYVAISPGKADEPDFGSVSSAEIAEATVNDYVAIPQHPDGGPKQICVTDNKVQSVFDSRLQYSADTSYGSSGAPVFNQRWQLVGMHRRGGALAGPTGAKHWVNEGIKIQDILEAIELRRDAGAPAAMPRTATNGTVRSDGPPPDLYLLVFSELRPVVADLLTPFQQHVDERVALERIVSEERLWTAFQECVPDDQTLEWAAIEGCACGAAFDAVVRPTGHESLKTPSASRGVSRAPFVDGAERLDRAWDIYQAALGRLRSPGDDGIASTLEAIVDGVEDDDGRRRFAAVFLRAMKAGGDRGEEREPLDPRDERWPRRPR
jgi:V8-like Glu-specific endopeptidase